MSETQTAIGLRDGLMQARGKALVAGRSGHVHHMADAMVHMIDTMLGAIGVRSKHPGVVTMTLPTAATLPDGKPEFAIEGQWEAPQPPDPVHGSLLHPYDVEHAHALTLVDGQRLAFPDKQAAEAWAGAHPQFFDRASVG